MSQAGVEAVYSSHSDDQPQICESCKLKISEKFVRALNCYFHLNCFRCYDCGESVANKFFPKLIKVFEANEETEKYVPLCELDYFRQLELLCKECKGPIRGSYITALNNKYHVDHFTCKTCSRVFGLQDNYFEHHENVYCELHYSLKFALRCHGCGTPILNQFVEIFRDEIKMYWHPECYMIQKFWNVRVTIYQKKTGHNDSKQFEPFNEQKFLQKNSNIYKEVKWIWSTLSCFEESSAGCVSDILLHISNANFADGIFAAHRLITHVEIIFTILDNLELLLNEHKKISYGQGCIELKCEQDVKSNISKPLIKLQDNSDTSIKKTSKHTNLNSDGAQWRREAKAICRKLICLFDLIRSSNSKDVKKISFTQNLLSLVTGLAHYLKLLIRISLTAVLRLEHFGEEASYLKKYLRELDQFLENPDTFESYATNLDNLLDVSEMCPICSHLIDSSCFKAKGTNVRVHSYCLTCHICKAELSQHFTTARWNFEVNAVTCQDHFKYNDKSFEAVSRMQQYIFLLNVSMARIYKLFLKDESKKYSPKYEQEINQVEHSLDLTKPSKGFQPNFSKNSENFKSQNLKLSKSSPIKIIAEEASEIEQNFPKNLDEEKTNDNTIYQCEVDQTLSLNDDAVISQDQQVEDFQEQVKDFDDPSMSEKNPEFQANFKFNAEVETKLAPNSRFKYLSELSALEMLIVRHLAIISMQPLVKDIFFDIEKILNAAEDRKSFWEKFKEKAFKSKDSEKRQPKRKIFGIALENMQMKDSLNTNRGVGPGSLEIPVFFDDLLSAMRKKDMSIEGVFRKNGNIRKLREIAKNLDKIPSSVNLNNENPVQLAALLKMFLRALPDPLLTFKLYKLWITAASLDDPNSRFRMLHLTCCLLPRVHRDTMEVLFVFLSWVASFSHLDYEGGSKMDIHNIATVLAPNILYEKEHESAQQSNYTVIDIVQTLIAYNSLFSTVPRDIASLLQDSSIFTATSNMSTDEILRKYEALLLKTQEVGNHESESDKPIRAQRIQTNTFGRQAGYHEAATKLI